MSVVPDRPRARRAFWAWVARASCLIVAYAVFAALLRFLPSGPQRYPLLFVPMETMALLAGWFYGPIAGAIIGSVPVVVNPLVSRIIGADPVPISLFEVASCALFGASGWAAGVLARYHRAVSKTLAICASCKKVRDEETGVWQQIEAYLTSSLKRVKFTHGYCPDCLKKVYEDLPGSRA